MRAGWSVHATLEGTPRAKPIRMRLWLHRNFFAMSSHREDAQQSQ